MFFFFIELYLLLEEVKILLHGYTTNKTTLPTIVPNPTSSFVINVPIILVNNSGAEARAAINVAPAYLLLNIILKCILSSKMT